MSIVQSDGSITLPPGVTIAARRETSQQGPNGQIVQGMAFTLQLPNTATTTVFVPYAAISDPAAVASAFNNRIAQLNAIDALQS